MIEHKNIATKLLNLIDNYHLDEKDITLFHTSVTFDASLEEYLMPLLVGAKMIIPSIEFSYSSKDLIDIIESYKISFISMVPTILGLLFNYDFDVKALNSLRIIASGGEALDSKMASIILRKMKATLYNMYGPTEATIDATMWNCSLATRKISIGKPLANVQLFILDDYYQPVPIGVSGELYIGGVGVARGYLNRPDLTAERFIANPFVSEADKEAGKNLRLYRTGDLVRYLADGNIEYLSRIDHQVKIRGFRIECGEIENNFRQHAMLNEAVVIAREDEPGEKRLVAYVVPKAGVLDEAKTGELLEALRAQCAAQLPDYMVPSGLCRR